MPDPLALRSSGFHLLLLSPEDWKDYGWGHGGWRGFHKDSLEEGRVSRGHRSEVWAVTCMSKETILAEVGLRERRTRT